MYYYIAFSKELFEEKNACPPLLISVLLTFLRIFQNVCKIN